MIPINTIRDHAYKIGCGRLLFSHGALKHLSAEVATLGQHPLVLCGEHAFQVVGGVIQKQLLQNNLAFQIERYRDACSEESAQHFAHMIAENRFDLIIGAGGGRILDLAKIIADLADIPVVTIPTISATCAAYTPLSVVYTPDGRCKGTWYFKREVSLVVCDLDILCSQPPRYLAAGMVDAIAKHVEIKHHLHALPPDAQDVFLAQQLAQTICQDLFSFGEAAMNDLHSDKAIRCIFHSIITTGMVSGIARGMYQAAMAHAFYEVIRTLFPHDSKPWLHGEIVGVGLRLQELYAGKLSEASQLTDFMRNLNMPLGLADLSIPVTEDIPHMIARTSPLPDFYLHPQTDHAKVSNIIQNLYERSL